jgi:hypothetical protein
MLCRFKEWLQYLLRSRVRVFWIPMMKRYESRSRAPPSTLTFFLHHVHDLTRVDPRLIRNSWNIKRYSDELAFFKSIFLRGGVQLDLILLLPRQRGLPEVHRAHNSSQKGSIK